MLCCNTQNWPAMPEAWQGSSGGDTGDCDVGDKGDVHDTFYILF